MSSDVKSYMATTTKHQRRYKKRDSNDRFVLLYAVHQALCQSDFGIYTLSQATMRGGPEPTYDYRWDRVWIHKRRFWCSTETSSPTRFSCSPAAGQAGCVKANDIDKKIIPSYQSCSTSLNSEMRRWWSSFYDHTHLYILCR